MLIGNDWDEVLKEEIESDWFKRLQQAVAQEYAQYTVYPSMVNVFNALRYTPYRSVKAVILGQDPYHGPGQAHGLAFSVQKGVPVPPSLQNIYKEMHEDIGFTIPHHGCLISWAEQGVLLLNTVLTVRAGQAGSTGGWAGRLFTDAGHPEAERPGGPGGLPPLGGQCPAEEAAHYKPPPPGLDRRPPEPPCRPTTVFSDAGIFPRPPAF